MTWCTKPAITLDAIQAVMNLTEGYKCLSSALLLFLNCYYNFTQRTTACTIIISVCMVASYDYWCFQSSHNTSLIPNATPAHFTTCQILTAAVKLNMRGSWILHDNRDNTFLYSALKSWLVCRVSAFLSFTYSTHSMPLWRMHVQCTPFRIISSV